MGLTLEEFELPGGYEPKLELPAGARVIGARERGGRILIRAAVDKSQPPLGHTFRVVSLGSPIDDIDELRPLGAVEIMGRPVEVFEKFPGTEKIG